MQVVAMNPQAETRERSDQYSDFPLAGTVGAVAEALCVSERTVWNLINTGQLGSIRVRRSVRVTRQQLRDFIEAQEG